MTASVKHKLVIAGGRDFEDRERAFRVLDRLASKLTEGREIKDAIEVVSGGARGADRMGELWSEHHGTDLTVFQANWNEHGKAAGHIRNAEMACYGSHLVAFWDGASRGTKNMIEQARKNGLKVAVINY